MGVLDQLRKEADQKKLSEQETVDQQALRAKLYKTQVLPKMQQIFKYLQELAEHLNYLEVPVQVENYSDRFPRLGTLMQKDYKINTDGYGGFSDFNKLVQINLTFYCIGKGELEYNVQTKSAIEQENAFLHAKRVASKMYRLGGAGREESAKFVVTKKIPVRVRFEVDYEQSQIKVMVNNHTDFSTYTEVWQPADIDDAFLDTLARYLLRKDSEFVSLDITDEDRNELRKKLQSIKHKEEQERLRGVTEQKNSGLEKKEKLGDKMKSFITGKINR
ncbi:hypothetical protein BAZMOX_01117_3 [methanotrophic endosymbiont of Bathymodiolus azoricus (Menez Gwen)]|jgi:hypothetical protein|nr:hypothetical protein BAZMOX_01117_3 [methanotrophic endosymbiont of Bathymodiolus azoricus (Menez Gwen)]